VNARARGDSGLDGFLNVCKPAGPTSHDVVATVRRILKTRRVGHAGTLDPLAEGVLPIALGRATRLVDNLAGADKEYYAEVVLGRTTTTDDAEGEIVAELPVPALTMADLEAALHGFRGAIEQLPPAFSALKVQGRRAYELAREGETTSLRPRRVTIFEIEVRRWEQPVVSLRVRCSKGTYIRSLARDLGAALGTGGSLQRLVRTRVGWFDLGSAVGLDELAAEPSRAILAADVASLDQPAVVLDELSAGYLHQGRRLTGAPEQACSARAYGIDGRFLGLLVGQRGFWQPRLVLSD
jgi:tRNA pseudouridine55 synthase